MKYPIISNWIRFKRMPDQDAYFVRNYILETENIVPAEKMRYAKKLDGKTDPYSIRGRKSISEVRVLLNELEDMGVIRTDHGSVSVEDGIHMRTVVRTKNEKYKRSISQILNYLLMVSFIPILILGIYVYMNVGVIKYHNLSALGRFVRDHTNLCIWICNFVSLICGGIFHEFCHGIACRAYGGRVFEYGVMFHIFPGLYTMMDDTKVKSKLQKVQILAAGVEGNIVVAGGFLLLSGVFPELKGILIVGAGVNLALVCLNMLALDGTDGMYILLLLLGIESEDFEEIKQLTKVKNKSELLKAEGGYGIIRLVACRMVICLRKIYPVVILLDVISLIGALL